jgi:hypothetical protein
MAGFNQTASTKQRALLAEVVGLDLYLASW